MRTHISNALQRRSKAIRNAVKTYNTAALALDPPRDTLDWSKVPHYSFLDQFNVLQDTRHSVFDQPWAKPVNRSLMKTRSRILRAQEEITWCNIEIRRVHTKIVDEGREFANVVQRLTDTHSPMLGPVGDYVTRRQGVNRLLLARIHQTYNLEGFLGDCTPGTRKGTRAELPLGSTNMHSTSIDDVDPGSDEGEVEDDDELRERIDNVEEFMANMSIQ